MESLKGIEKVFIYLRKSRDNGEGLESLDNHKRTLLEVCKRNNWADIKVYEEIGTSQSIEARPIFSEMLDAIKEGEADLILSMDLDRLSRGSLGEWDYIKKVFRESATFFMNASGTVYNYADIDSTFTSDLLSVLSSYEYSQIKKRLSRGKKSAHAKGFWVSGTPPMGYVYNRYTKKLDVDEDQAKTYHLIKTMALQGKTNGVISKELNNLGLKTVKGSRFTPTAIYRLLTNPSFKGEIVLRRSTGSHKDGTYKALPQHEWEITKNTHEALISMEDFDRIQKLLQSRNITPVNARRGMHILSGLVHCGYCGRLNSITIPQKGHTSSYVKPCGDCRKKGIHSIVLEDIIASEAGSLLQKVREGRPQVAGRTKELHTRIDAGTKAIAKATAGLERLTDIFLDGMIDKDEYKRRQKELQEAQKGAEHAVVEATKALQESKGEDLPAYIERLEKLLSAWKNKDISVEAKNRLAKGLIHNITYKWEGLKLDELVVSVEFQ